MGGRRDLLLLTGSVGVSAAGDWLALVALAVRIEDSAGSALPIAALFICLWAPVALLAGHVGVLVDRVETTRLLAVVSVAQAGVAAALAFADSLGVVLALAALLGTGFAIAQAAEFALVPAVARPERVREANGYVETARYAGFMLGPVVGSVLAAAAGVEAALLVNAATFVLVAAAALVLRVRRPPAAAGTDDTTARARDGIVHLFRERELALAMTVAFASLLFMSASIPADVIFVERELGIEDVGLGPVISAWTVGMIVGALVLAKRVPLSALAAVAFAAVAVQGLGKFVAPFWLSFGFMLGCYAVGGLGHGLKNVTLRTLIHHRVPQHLHGRAFAAYNGLRNGAELGALAAGGILVTVLGARGTLWIAGGVSALAGLAGLAALRRWRRAPDTVESPAASVPQS